MGTPAGCGVVDVEWVRLPAARRWAWGASGGGARAPGGVRPFPSALDPWRVEQTVSFGASRAVRVGWVAGVEGAGLRHTRGRACAFVVGLLVSRVGSRADGKGLRAGW